MLGIKNESKWKEITFFEEDVVVKKEDKYLFVMPVIGNEQLVDKAYFYNGYKFWFPTKLLKENGSKVVLSYSPDFMFRLYKQNKNEQGEYETIDQKELSGDELKQEIKNCLKDYDRLKVKK